MNTVTTSRTRSTKPSSWEAISESDIVVLVSGGFRTSYEALIPAFERSSGAHLVMEKSPSLGETHDAVRQRLDRGEPADVLVMVGSALQELEAKGYVLPGSRMDLASSPIGCAVKAGAEVPDINDDDSFRKALLAAKSIAYSDSASGEYILTTLFKKLGIESEMKGKAHQISATPVGEIIARGEAEVGFQEVEELLPIHGITYIGKLPPDLELLTIFSAGIATKSKHVSVARDLVAYLASRDNTTTIKDKGLEPLVTRSPAPFDRLRQGIGGISRQAVNAPHSRSSDDT